MVAHPPLPQQSKSPVMGPFVSGPAPSAVVPSAIAYTDNIILTPAGTPDSIIKIKSNTMNKVMSDRVLLDSRLPLADKLRFGCASFVHQ
jgi:hypothetical protein